MASVREISQTQTKVSNGDAEIERLSALVDKLQHECARLRQVLATTEIERNGYLKELYANARTAREFEDVDIASLERISAGPVETID